MPARAWPRTASATASCTRADSSASFTGCPASRARSNAFTLSGRGMLPTWVVRMRSVLVFIVGSSLGSLHRQDDLAGLRVAQHVLVGVGEPLERKRAVEHGLERALRNGLEQVGGEPLPAPHRLLRR